MSRQTNFEYYYGIEAEQFAFYRVPRLLVKDPRFKGLSSDAKLLYGLMLDRMSLSMKNGWFDEKNRAYIIYTVENIMEDLGCSKPTCVKIMRELDCENGIGLIEKKRRGLGKPDLIYVKNFSSSAEKAEGKTSENPEDSSEVKKLNFRKKKDFTSKGKETELQEVKETDLQKERIMTSGGKQTEPAQVKEVVPNYTDYSQTEKNDTESIIQSTGEKMGDLIADRMEEVNAYIEIIKDNIEYEYHMKYDDDRDRELYEELFQIICEVVCVRRPAVKIAGELYPYELVKSKYLKLNSSHLQYVIRGMQETTTKISNIKAYLVTALYNAPMTINHYYQQEAQHDMYGGGWQEKGVI